MISEANEEQGEANSESEEIELSTVGENVRFVMTGDNQKEGLLDYPFEQFTPEDDDDDKRRNKCCKCRTNPVYKTLVLAMEIVAAIDLAYDAVIFL